VTLRQRLDLAFQPAPADAVQILGDWAALGTAIGPRAENQDRAFIAIIPAAGLTRPAFMVAAVLDGMGGMEQGGLAASLAATTFLETLLEPSGLAIDRLLGNAIEVANHTVHDQLSGRGGTTLTALALTADSEGWIVHAGDSRLYRHDTERGLDQLTVDDTMAGMLGLEDDSGLDTGLMQFVGIGAGFLFQSRSIEPLSGTSLIALTDGAYFVGTNILRGIHDRSLEVGDSARATMEAAATMGTQDNATVVVVDAAAAALALASTISPEIELWLPGGRADLE
jgi:serine/threonine protein phosphatase PrpC